MCSEGAFSGGGRERERREISCWPTCGACATGARPAGGAAAAARRRGAVRWRRAAGWGARRKWAVHGRGGAFWGTGMWRESDMRAPGGLGGRLPRGSGPRGGGPGSVVGRGAGAARGGGGRGGMLGGHFLLLLFMNSFCCLQESAGAACTCARGVHGARGGPRAGRGRRGGVSRYPGRGARSETGRRRRARRLGGGGMFGGNEQCRLGKLRRRGALAALCVGPAGL